MVIDIQDIMIFQSEHEIRVFLEFAQVKKMAITLKDAEQCEPHEPDLWYKVTEGIVYYELGRILDPEMQRLRLHAMRGAPKPVSLADCGVKLPEREMLNRKITHLYETGGAPVELLLYYDHENWLVWNCPVHGDLETQGKAVMRPICESQSRFQRVWVFDRVRQRVVWSYP